MTQLDTLHVLTSFTQPPGGVPRAPLYRNFARHMATFPKVRLWTIEGIWPGQSYRVTQANDPHHVQVNLEDYLWYKENLLNVLARHLPDDGQPIAWIDADLHFTRPRWDEAVLDALRTYDAVQPFGVIEDLDPHGAPLPYSAASSLVKAQSDPSLGVGHSGAAWAMRRSLFEGLGGLFDRDLVGRNDFIMDHALLQNAQVAIPEGCTEGYRRTIESYARRATRANPQLGYVDGQCLHAWHGDKRQRRYATCVQIQTRAGFDPLVDLTTNSQGLLRLANDDRLALMREQLKTHLTLR